MTSIRQLIQPGLTFVVLFAGYGLYAYNRKSVTYSLPSMVREGVTRQQAGSIASSQNLAYLIGKFVAGILSDRFSPRLLFSSGLALSALSTAIFSFCSSIPLLIGLWFLNGLAQGAGWPAVAKLVRRVSPHSPKHVVQSPSD
jgi:sugar phosphate permease